MEVSVINFRMVIQANHGKNDNKFHWYSKMAFQIVQSMKEKAEYVDFVKAWQKWPTHFQNDVIFCVGRHYDASF